MNHRSTGSTNFDPRSRFLHGLQRGWDLRSRQARSSAVVVDLRSCWEQAILGASPVKRSKDETPTPLCPRAKAPHGNRGVGHRVSSELFEAAARLRAAVKPVVESPFTPPKLMGTSPLNFSGADF